MLRKIARNARTCAFAKRLIDPAVGPGLSLRRRWPRLSLMFSLLVAVLAPGCVADNGALLRQQQAAAEVEALFSHFSEEGSPGVAVMVIRDGGALHVGGYGLADLESRTPITPLTSFRLASVSKQFAAMAIMILAERGELAYDDPLIDYLPQLERFGDRITLRHLLTHTGGLPDYYEGLEEEAADSMPDTRRAMEFLSGWGEALFPAGERYEYSNPGYEMLALVVERVSGQTFRAFVQENIFGPLGMTDSVVRDSSEPEIATRAYGYSKDGDSFKLNDDHILNHIIGSGGIYSTLEDLALWDQALYTDTLVSRSTLEEAWSPMRLNDGGEYPYGFGWRLGRYGSLGRRLAHAGGWVGFSTYVVRYPERRFTVILLSNLEDFQVEAFADRITDIYYPSTLIAGATVVDGSGAPAFRADVRVVGDRIAAVGELDAESDEPIIDAAGLMLAPGFIDAHSHAGSEIVEHPDALAAVSQGITTTVVGPDGGSQFPLAEFFAGLEKRPAAVNVASFAGHGTLRRQVMGDDFARPASAGEVEKMRALLEQEMKAGALGLSTGLEYDPGIYSTTEEVVELARVAASLGGSYISHLRSEDRWFWQAVDEILTIGREAGLPVQITHIKLALRSLHGQTDRLLGLLDEARIAGLEVTADIYPYTYWQSTLTVLFPDRDFEDLQEATFVLDEMTSPDEMWIPVFLPEPALAGKTLGEIAALRGTDPPTTLIDLIREAEAMRREMKGAGAEEETVESVIAVSMREPDIERLMAWPPTMFCTDGGLDGSHPRGFGSFPRILGRYVRERGVLSLETAVNKATARAADHFGLRERGRIEVGAFADLVLFDPETVIDRATPEDPHAVSAGIAKVWVNGRLVYEDGRASGRRPGKVLRRSADS